MRGHRYGGAAFALDFARHFGGGGTPPAPAPPPTPPSTPTSTNVPNIRRKRARTASIVAGDDLTMGGKLGSGEGKPNLGA